MKHATRFGEFGGTFVPEILYPALEELEAGFVAARADPAFRGELRELLRDYAGRPTPLYRCQNLAGDTGARIYLKREDLLHGGAHKTNQVLGQGLLVKRLGKKRVIAETGAGQHGVATALAGALFGLETRIYMGERDVERQALNVFRMQLMGAEVIPVSHGSRTLKDAVNATLREWAGSYETTHYMLGSVVGPHPFPWMVREFQRVIGEEAKTQIVEAEGRLPDAVIACVGGGSNAIGIFSDFVENEEVELIGVEAAGRGLHTQEHGSTLQRGDIGILHGSRSLLLRDGEGQVKSTHSVAAGLDYPGVGPEHAHLQARGRATYVGATDEEAIRAFEQLARAEGIIPALESAHAVAHAITVAREANEPVVLVVCLSGRGDKDMAEVRSILQGSEGAP